MTNYVVEFIQRGSDRLDPADAGTAFCGGTTVIFDHRGEALYAIEKSVVSPTRLQRWRDYDQQIAARSALRTFCPDQRDPMSFAMIHRGC